MTRSPRRLVIALLCLGSLGLATACGSDDGSSDDAGSEPSSEQSSEGVVRESPSEDAGSDSDSGPASVEPSDATAATVHTSLGDIEVTLFPEQAPLAVTNFAGLADGSLPYEGQEGDEPLYDGTVFHRVIADFMIQGGDPEGTGMGGPGYEFPNETSPDLTFEDPYRLAMANAGPDTNGSQFFITVAPTTWLDGGYSIFGEVTDEASREVVDSIAAVETDANDKPVETVVIESIEVAE